MPAVLMRIPEVTKVTGILEPTLRYMRHIGTGPKSFKLAGRVVYKEADVLAWIEAEYERQTAEVAS